MASANFMRSKLRCLNEARLTEEPFLHKKGNLLELAQAVTTIKDAEVVGTHLLEEGVINPVHHSRSQKSLMIFGGKKLRGLGIKFLTTIRLVVHKCNKAFVMDPLNKIILGVFKAPQIMERNVDTITI